MDYITKNKVQISYMDFRGLCVRWAYETIQVIFAFGMYTIALISLVVKLLKNDKKK